MLSIEVIGWVLLAGFSILIPWMFIVHFLSLRSDKKNNDKSGSEIDFLFGGSYSFDAEEDVKYIYLNGSLFLEFSGVVPYRILIAHYYGGFWSIHSLGLFDSFLFRLKSGKKFIKI